MEVQQRVTPGTNLVLLLQSNDFRKVDYRALHAGKVATSARSNTQRQQHPITRSIPVYAFHDNEYLLPRAMRARLPFDHCLAEAPFQVGHV